MKKIVHMIFGSHLYGTDTPQSDKDYKGVYMPSRDQILLSRFPSAIHSSTGNMHQKNSSEDVDSEVFSLHRFVELACEGQTVALDMLHAPDSAIIESSDVWRELVKHRSKFYTKDLRAFLGYCRKQAAKYGIKGSRLNDARSVLRFLLRFPSETKLSSVWGDLPIGEHIHFLEPSEKDTNQYRIYQVCGKKFHETVRVESVIESMKRFILVYGSRAELAAKNQGVDWKALSHAMRAAFQLLEVYSEGTMTFPLKQAEFLKCVKSGLLNYTTEVAPRLESLIEKVEILSESSTFPEKVDREYWDQFVMNAISNEYGFLRGA